MKRRRISDEEKIARLEKQNTTYEAKIAANKKKIEELRSPKFKMKDLAVKIKASNISIEQVMDMLDKMK